MRHTAVLPLTLALTLCACLDVPPPPPRDAGPSAREDASPPPQPPSVVALEITDRRGGAWSPAAIARNPILRVRFSGPIAGEPPIWLFHGPADEDLVDDLGAKPLRAATMDRLVGVSLEGTGAEWTLTPGRLPRGAELALGAGAWLEGTSGLRMRTPWAQSLVVSGAPEAGAAVAASWPPDGSAAVPPSIAALLVRFDGPVTNVAEGVALRDEDGNAVDGTAAPVDCPAHGWADGWCARFVPERPLAPGRAHRLEVGEAVLDATGAPVGPWAARFTTAATEEDEPPALLPLPCALDELPLGDGAGCVLAGDGRIVVRVQASEPTRIALSVAGRTLLAVAPRGDATLSAGDLPPETGFTAVLTVRDLADQLLERTFTLATTEPLATVSIVEVRADPNGSEPRQEYVEVLNYGPVSVDLEGMSISDRAGSMGDVVLRSQRLAPGQRALLVADGFDPEDAADTPVPPGVPLVRIGTSLATSGITNAGEAIFLRDASMRRLSAAPALATGAGACLVRAAMDEPRGGEPALFAVVEPCTPGVPP